MAGGDERPGREWFNREECALFLDVTPNTFDKVYRPKLPESATRRVKRRPWFRGRDVAAAFAEVHGRAEGDHREIETDFEWGEDDDDLQRLADMQGWGEPLKREMTLIKRQERRVKERELTTVDDVRGNVEACALACRRAIEDAMRLLSEDGRKALEERLDQIDAAIDDVAWEAG